MIHIIKSKDVPNGYWINNKGILADNIQFHKKHCKYFTNEELDSLIDFIKAEENEKNK